MCRGSAVLAQGTLQHMDCIFDKGMIKVASMGPAIRPCATQMIEALREEDREGKWSSALTMWLMYSQKLYMHL